MNNWSAAELRAGFGWKFLFITTYCEKHCIYNIGYGTTATLSNISPVFTLYQLFYTFERMQAHKFEKTNFFK